MLAFLCAVNEDVYGTALDIRMRDADSGDLTCVGSILSIREGHVCLKLNIRYCISADSRQLIERMERMCARHGCGFACLRDSQPGYFPKEHPVVEALTSVYNECTGENAVPYVMGGGTYARKLPRALGFGLGGLMRRDSPIFRAGHGHAHCPDEALDIDGFLKALGIFAVGVVRADTLVD